MASLDPASPADVLDTLRSVDRERGITVLSSLHQVDLATRFADRIVGPRDGRVVVDGPTDDFGPAGYERIFGRPAQAPASIG
ncbi:MAG: hypothetical protein M3P50_07670 [Actinomycetota bacterium]|nr:hypothetical protein [Actinomycetota bacterium]